jgi:hypothetical protein
MATTSAYRPLQGSSLPRMRGRAGERAVSASERGLSQHPRGARGRFASAPSPSPSPATRERGQKHLSMTQGAHA